jgi:hypothetical protein
MKGIVLISLLYFLSALANAQENSFAGPNIHTDPKITELMRYRAHWADSVGVYDGFRVQIFSSSGPLSKTQALEEKAKFMMAYPNVTPYLIPQMPYFKVRVGDFKERIEALRFYHEIKLTYPNAFVVPDEIIIK